MRRITRRSAVGILALVITAGLAPAASVGTSSTSVDTLSKRYGLLRESDLPDGWTIDDVKRETGARARSVEVTGDCDRINPNVMFLGAEPVMSYAAFSDPASTGAYDREGAQVVYVFEDESDAKEYQGRWDAGFEELAECGLMATPSGTIGTYADLVLGKVAEQRTAVTFDPRTDEHFTRLAVARADTIVVYLALADDDATDAEFRSLLKTALDRAD